MSNSPTDEFACHRNEYQDEIAASEGIAMALLTANHPPLRIEKRRGAFPIAVNQIENEVFHRNEIRIEILIALVMILTMGAGTVGVGAIQTMPRRCKGGQCGRFAPIWWHKGWIGRLPCHCRVKRG